MTPAGASQEGTGGVIEADEFLLVETGRVDGLLELLDLLLGDVVEGAAVAVGRGPVVVAHDPPPPPPPPAPAPRARPHQHPHPAPLPAVPLRGPVAMLNVPDPCNRELWPKRMTSGRV